MGVSYQTVVVGNGPHASLHIPDEVLAEAHAGKISRTDMIITDLSDH